MQLILNEDDWMLRYPPFKNPWRCLPQDVCRSIFRFRKFLRNKNYHRREEEWKFPEDVTRNDAVTARSLETKIESSSRRPLSERAYSSAREQDGEMTMVVDSVRMTGFESIDFPK